MGTHGDETMSNVTSAAELRAAERLRRSGKLEKAADALQSLVAKFPSDADVRRKLADVQLEMGNRDAAISQYVKIQEQLVVDGDVLGAITAGLKVVEIDPKFDNPLAYVAKVKVESLRDEQKAKAAQTVAVRPITPLDDIPLLSDLTPEELSDVAATMRRHELSEEQILFQEGDAGESLYFVNEGLLEAKAAGWKLGLISSDSVSASFRFSCAHRGPRRCAPSSAPSFSSCLPTRCVGSSRTSRGWQKSCSPCSAIERW